MEAGYVAPEGEVERTIAAIIAGFVGHDQVGATDSFFALGGDSIMSIQLSSALRAAGYELRPRDIFELKTVRALAHAVGERGSVVLDELPADPAARSPSRRWSVDARKEVTLQKISLISRSRRCWHCRPAAA